VVEIPGITVCVEDCPGITVMGVGSVVYIVVTAMGGSVVAELGGVHPGVPMKGGSDVKLGNTVLH